jgi:hypothetical protein
VNDRSYTPEELERLLTLPEDHPERRAAAASPRFEALRRMLAEFERPTDALVTDAELASARVELRRRLAEAGLLDSPAATRAPTPAAPQAPRSLPRPGVLVWLLTGGGRPAFAVAAALIVVGIGWWTTQRPTRETTRAIATPGAFELATRLEGDGLVLSWRAVEGADGYRVVFLDAGLAEVARLDVPTGTSLTLRAGELPAGVSPGSRVSLEVVALRMGDALSTTPARTILLP